MTRKITLAIILIALIFACYVVLFSEYEVIRNILPSVFELQASSKTLETSVANLEKISSTEYDEKKNLLNTTIEEYKKAKTEYESIVPVNTGKPEIEITALKDVYDIDFLWTIVGNYATEEGINLKFDVKRNNNSLSSINNTSSNYVVCDLEFTITGNYINLTDFMYDIEDDDRLNFEINDFSMAKVIAKKDLADKAVDLTTDPDWYDDEKPSTSTGDSNQLQVTLVVKEVKINANNLIENGTVEEIVENISSSIDEQTSKRENTVTNTTSTNTTKNTVENTTANTQKTN